jgi:SAM-dependent methyltransferase
MDLRCRDDWARFDGRAIPSKSELAPLERWCDRLDPAQRILDLGCGAGPVSQRLLARGFRVVGVDINAEGLQQARQACPNAQFFERDIAASAGLALPERDFAGVVCQLVLSIVGDASDRLQLLHNARGVLAHDGHLFASFSGVSDDLNPEYARLYTSDFALTGETATYVSRDAAGKPLYRTHHFSRDEITDLLAQCGFEPIALEEKIEASSRRPDQRARFFYASARRT